MLEVSENDVNSTTVLEIVSSLEEALKDLKSLFDIEEGSDGDSDSDEIWQNDCEILLKVVVHCTDMAILLHEKLIGIQSSNLELKEEVKWLREECKVLDEIENHRLTLMVGQLAFEVEQRIIERVLAGLVRSDQHIRTIVQLEMAIKRKEGFDDVFESEEDRKTAASKWTAFKDQFSWKGRHSRYIKELKDVRLPIAHPKCDLKIIQEALANGTFVVRDKKLFKEFLKIYEQKW